MPSRRYPDKWIRPPGLTRSSAHADWLVGGFAVVTAVYFTSEVMAYEIGGYGDAGPLLGAIAVVVLSCCTLAAIRLSAMLAAGQAPGAMLGAGTSVRVRSSTAIFVALYFTLIPALIALSQGIGGSGTTDVPMGGRSAVFILLETWVAIVVAPWLEEVSVRGFLLSGLAPRLGFWPAALVSSFAWAAYHDVSVVLLPFTALGIMFCWAAPADGHGAHRHRPARLHQHNGLLQPRRHRLGAGAAGRRRRRLALAGPRRRARAAAADSDRRGQRSGRVAADATHGQLVTVGLGRRRRRLHRKHGDRAG